VFFRRDQPHQKINLSKKKEREEKTLGAPIEEECIAGDGYVYACGDPQRRPRPTPPRVTLPLPLLLPPSPIRFCTVLTADMRAAQIDPSLAAPPKSRLKRLFERQVLRVSPAERLPSAPPGGGEKQDEVSEPSSLCLDGMVRSFLEDGGGAAERGAAARCCNCFHAGDTSDDEDGPAAADAAAADIAETIKVVQYSLVVLVAASELFGVVLLDWRLPATNSPFLSCACRGSSTAPASGSGTS
jgi:hypothetical protein